MAEIEGIDKLFSTVPRKRFGRFRCYGRAMYGHSVYGEDEIIFNSGINGDITLTGIYRTDNVTGKTKYYREPYYITRNPRTVPQQANRTKFADAVAAWQALTPDEKNVYNERAKRKHLPGYNLFLREYLLSH